MAATATTSEVASGAVKCKSWVLKVSIHCEGCKREVKKALQKLQGVYTISVDSEKNEVRVRGSIESDALLDRLLRMGKRAEIVHQKSPAKQNLALQRAPSVEPPSSSSDAPAAAAAAECRAPKSAECRAPKSQNPGKNSKGKGNKKGNVEEALPNAGFLNNKATQPDSRPSQSQPQPQPRPQEVVLSYNQCVPLQASVYSDADQREEDQEAGKEEAREGSHNSFDMFSEENANGCSIM